MSGLTLSLRPRERFLVGGHLVENGPRRSSIRIADDSVMVLRLSDALHPEDVTTPVRHAYHAAQLILACEVSTDAGAPELMRRLTQLTEVFRHTVHEPAIARVREHAEAGRYHGVIMGLKSLMAVEETLLLAPPEPIKQFA